MQRLMVFRGILEPMSQMIIKHESNNSNYNVDKNSQIYVTFEFGFRACFRKKI